MTSILKTIFKIKCVLILFFITNISTYASEIISWVDFPYDNLQQILYKYDPKLDKLNSLIQSYHAIPKNNWDGVHNRIKALNAVSDYALTLQGQFSDKYFNQLAIKFSGAALAKSNYLKKLYDLHQGGYKARYYEIHNPLQLSSQYVPLFIYDGRKYNYNTQELWGDYLIEAIDPCHRRLLSRSYNIWKQKYSSDEILDFFLWLEDQDVSVFVPSIKVFNSEELKNHEVFIKGDKFYSSDGKLLTTLKQKIHSESYNGIVFNKEHIFIIDSEGRIYACYSGADVNHISMSNYKPIIGSGKFVLTNGEVQLLSFDSGHYLPTKLYVAQTIKFFENLGIAFKDTAKLEYYQDFGKVSVDFKKYREILSYR